MAEGLIKNKWQPKYIFMHSKTYDVVTQPISLGNDRWNMCFHPRETCGSLKMLYDIAGQALSMGMGITRKTA